MWACPPEPVTAAALAVNGGGSSLAPRSALPKLRRCWTSVPSTASSAGRNDPAGEDITEISTQHRIRVRYRYIIDTPRSPDRVSVRGRGSRLSGPGLPGAAILTLRNSCIRGYQLPVFCCWALCYGQPEIMLNLLADYGDCCYFPVTDPRSGLLRQQCTNVISEDAVNGDIGLCVLLEGDFSALSRGKSCLVGRVLPRS